MTNLPKTYAALLVQENVQTLKTILDWISFSERVMHQAGCYFGHGTTNSTDESIALVLQILELPADYPSACWQAAVTPVEANYLLLALKQRVLDKKPLPYITGKAWQAGFEFFVSEHTLIPRSPIAHLILEDRLIDFPGDRPLSRVLDMCTGSGCLAIIAAEHFGVAVDAVDIDQNALKIAQKNIAAHGLSDQVSIVQSDLFAEIDASAQYNLMIANPPYVDANELALCPDEYRHEPKKALESGEDGLLFPHKILAKASDFLTDDGILLLEVGASVETLAAAYPSAEFIWLDEPGVFEGVLQINKAGLLALREQALKNLVDEGE